MIVKCLSSLKSWSKRPTKLVKRQLFLALFTGLSLYTPISVSAPNINKTGIDKTNIDESSPPDIHFDHLSFIAAEESLQNRNIAAFEQQLMELASHPLQAYLVRDRLIQRIPNNPSNEIRTFLATYDSQPVSRKLRREWLRWLAKTNQESAFLSFYQPTWDKRLQCQYFSFSLNSGAAKRDIYPQIKRLWLSPKSLPDECDPVFSRWKADGQITDSLIWQRMQLALKARQTGLYKFLNRQRSPARQESGKLLLKAYRNPMSLNKIVFAEPLSAHAEDIIQTALNRLAWQDPGKAISLWQKLSNKYHLKQDFGTLRRAIALSLAINSDPRANEWLSALPSDNDESVQQWLLSTAISQKNWRKVEQLAAHFSESGENSNKWRYWLAVSQVELGQPENSRLLFESIADQRSYYGFLASNQLERNESLQHNPVEFDVNTLSDIEKLPAALRARAFFDMDRLAQARSEWNYLASQLGQAEQLKLAVIAHRWGWQHQSILAFARSKQIDDLDKRFPLHLLDEYTSHAENYKVPVSWAYAITRQESAFKTDAVSSAGARGLMQLKHSTAKMAARKRLNYRRSSQLLEAETNILLGTAHLSDMYREFAHPVLATAAYNAGEYRVKQWLSRIDSDDAIQWIEQIPYRETRDYVKNVLTYQLIYARLTNQEETFIGQLHQRPISPISLSSAAR